MLAVGGSATVDGGVGAAMALGWQFLKGNGDHICLGGQELSSIKEIKKQNDLDLPPMSILSDVDNPLCGESGAAIVYGPQKGATSEMVKMLESGLSNLAKIIKKKYGLDISSIPRGGAAGGLAAGAVAFMNAQITSGIDCVMKHYNLLNEMKTADWIVTGEGSFDQQSLRGKVISGVAKVASKTNTKIAVLAGQINGVSDSDYTKLGINTVISCKKDNMPSDWAMSNCDELLDSAAREFVKQYVL